jgi:hypothetical protein
LGGHGGGGDDALSVDSSGVVTVTGWTTSINFPTTSGAYDTTYNGPFYYDVFVSRLDPQKSGGAQLVLAGSRSESRAGGGHNFPATSSIREEIAEQSQPRALWNTIGSRGSRSKRPDRFSMPQSC